MKAIVGSAPLDGRALVICVGSVLWKSAELTETPLFVHELFVLFAAGLLSLMIVVPVNAMLLWKISRVPGISVRSVTLACSSMSKFALLLLNAVLLVQSAALPGWWFA